MRGIGRFILALALAVAGESVDAVRGSPPHHVHMRSPYTSVTSCDLGPDRE